MKLTAFLLILVVAHGTDAVAVQCPDVSNGNVVIAHQFECSSFYLCDGSPKPSFLLRCPTGMLFGEEGTMGTGVAGGGCVQEAECRPQLEVGAVPAARGARALPHVDSPGDYQNYTMHLPNPANCSQFYRYEGDVEPQLFECPSGLGFDPVLESCDSKAKCRSSSGSSGGSSSGSSSCQHVGPPVCPRDNDRLVHLPHPTDCTKFFKCNWGNPVLFDCPDNLYFNPTSEVCDWPRNVPCDRCPPGDRVDEEVPDGEVPDEDAPEGEQTGGEGKIDARFGRQDGGKTPPSGSLSAQGQGRLPERAAGQGAGQASKGGRPGDRQGYGQTTATGVQPNYRGQGAGQGYQPPSQEYQPTDRAYQPTNRQQPGYPSEGRGFQQPNQGYQPTSQGQQPGSRQQPNQGYQPTSQGQQPGSRQQPNQDYQPPNRGYQPQNQGYQPTSQGQQPGSRQQPNQSYQPQNRGYQPDNRQQPGQEHQPSEDPWNYDSQGQPRPGQASRSLQGHREYGSRTQIQQTVDGYPVYQPDASTGQRGQGPVTPAAARGQHQTPTVAPRSEHRPTPPVRRYLTAPLDSQGQGQGQGRPGGYQPVMTMAPVGRYQPEDQSQAGSRTDDPWQGSARPGSQSQGEPRWVDGERPAPAPRVQMKPTSGVGGRPQYYQPGEPEQSLDTQGRQPYDSQGRQPYNADGRQPPDDQGRHPYDAQAGQPYGSQGRQPYDAQAGQPYGSQGRQPTDTQGRQWYDSQGRVLQLAQPSPRPSQPNASPQSPPSRDFHSVRVYHPESRATTPSYGQATPRYGQASTQRYGQASTPRYGQGGYQPREPYQPLDQDTDQGPDAGIEQVSYQDPDEDLYGNTARPQAANQRGEQQRPATPQPGSASARAHQRPTGTQYAATPRPEDSNFEAQYDDETSQPRTRSVDSQMPGLSDLRTRPVGSETVRSSELRAEPPRPVYQHVMRIPTPNEVGRKA